MSEAYKIYQMFLEHPHLNACPVFHDYHFQGILLKRDLEKQLSKSYISWEDIFMQVPSQNIEELIFCSKPQLKMSIPYLNLSGKLVGSLLYEEFVSEFFPQDFHSKLSFKEIFEYHEYPILILNKFKTILYLNKQAINILSEKVFGLKVTEALLAFDVSINEHNLMILSRQNEQWNLQISKSTSPHSQYYIYQFIPKIPNKVFDIYKTEY